MNKNLNKTVLGLSASIICATALSFSTTASAGVGEDTYNGFCASCHGAKGNAPIIPTYPKLAGQNAAYTLKQIKDFQTGVRKDATMNAMVNLIRGKEQAVSDYLAAQ